MPNTEGLFPIAQQAKDLFEKILKKLEEKKERDALKIIGYLFHAAIREGAQDFVKNLLIWLKKEDLFDDFFAKGKVSQALFIAIEHERLMIFYNIIDFIAHQKRPLLTKKLLNARDHNGYTPLTAAIEKSAIKLRAQWALKRILRLLGRKENKEISIAVLNAEDDHKQTPLMAAIDKNKIWALKELFAFLKKNKGIKKSILNASNSEGNTALISAVLQKKAKIVKKILNFLEKEEPPTQREVLSAKNKASKTALMIAVEEKNQEIINILLRLIKSFAFPFQYTLLNEKSLHKNTATQAQFEKSKTAFKRELKEIFPKNQALIKKLLSQKPTLSKEDFDSFKMIQIEAHIEKQIFPFFLYNLRQANALNLIKNKSVEQWVLFLKKAVKSNWPYVEQSLIQLLALLREKEADAIKNIIKQLNEKNCSIFQYAAKKKKRKIAQIFLACLAKINDSNLIKEILNPKVGGTPPLLEAIKSSNREILADILAFLKEKKTIGLLKKEEIIEMLNAQDNAGKTALLEAAQAGDVGAVKAILAFLESETIAPLLEPSEIIEILTPNPPFHALLHAIEKGHLAIVQTILQFLKRQNKAALTKAILTAESQGTTTLQKLQKIKDPGIDEALNALLQEKKERKSRFSKKRKKHLKFLFDQIKAHPIRSFLALSALGLAIFHLFFKRKKEKAEENEEALEEANREEIINDDAA